MAQFDMPLAEMRAYAPALAVPADLDAFWAATLAEARSHDLAATFTPVDTGLTVISTFDVTYAGYGGSPVRAWLHLPAGRQGPLPAVVEYIGYGGGRGLAHERVMWAAAGLRPPRHGHPRPGLDLVRRRHAGPRPDRGAVPPRVHDPGHPRSRRPTTTAGCSSTPCARVEVARTHEAIDPGRIARDRRQPGRRPEHRGRRTRAGDVCGAAMPDVPFLSDFPRAITLKDTDPYAEIARYLKAHRDHVERVLATLAYFDVAILGRRATAPRSSRWASWTRPRHRRPCTPRSTGTAARRRSGSTRSTTTRAARASTTWRRCAGCVPASVRRPCRSSARVLAHHTQGPLN